MSRSITCITLKAYDINVFTSHYDNKLYYNISEESRFLFRKCEFGVCTLLKLDF